MMISHELQKENGAAREAPLGDELTRIKTLLVFDLFVPIRVIRGQFFDCAGIA